MKTTSYSATRTIVQLLAASSLIANLLTLLYIYIFDYSDLEHKLSKKPTLMFCDMSFTIIGINVLFSVASACCITSKIRPLMKVYGKLLYAYVAFSCSAAAYFYLFYIDSLITSLSTEFITPNAGFASLLRGYGVTPINGSLVEAFRVHLKHLVGVFCMTQVGVGVGAYIQANLFSYTSGIELEKPSEKIPKIANAKDLGCSRVVNYRNPIQRVGVAA